ncbi:DUF302 domain-containing protein [Bradyrhizobium sp. NBAIM03]|uniref:DUF302 domain-containing protein n=1 Tax=Bradyrhizobium sp. NBAIM03 TaxID=2793816 RepID=UPI0032092EDE|nr:DUF302 domain-containing protein [Bradyrhizobium sp. NBAIM03]
MDVENRSRSGRRPRWEQAVSDTILHGGSCFGGQLGFRKGCGDHDAGAEEAGLPLRPTDLLVFRTAKGGTPLMQSQQTIGIDLPLKALVWEDADGTTSLAHNDPAYLAHRHNLAESTSPVTAALLGALKSIAAKATSVP